MPANTLFWALKWNSSPPLFANSWTGRNISWVMEFVLAVNLSTHTTPRTTCHIPTVLDCESAKRSASKLKTFGRPRGRRKTPPCRNELQPLQSGGESRDSFLTFQSHGPLYLRTTWSDLTSVVVTSGLSSFAKTLFNAPDSWSHFHTA